MGALIGIHVAAYAGHVESDIRPYVVHVDEAPVEAWDGIVSWRTLCSADRTPTAGMTVGVAEVPVGGTVDGAEHRHDQHEVYFVLSGSGRVLLDGSWHAVGRGATVFVPGGTHHCVENTGDDPLELLYVLDADSFHEVEYVFPDEGRSDIDGAASA